MLTAGVGLSKQSDTEQATREAAQAALSQAGGDRADFALVFATAHHGAGYGRVLRTVRAEVQASQVVGCSAGGVLTSAGEVERAPGVAVLAVRLAVVVARLTVLGERVAVLLVRLAVVGERVALLALCRVDVTALFAVLAPRVAPRAVFLPALVTRLAAAAALDAARVKRCVIVNRIWSPTA